MSAEGLTDEDVNDTRETWDYSSVAVARYRKELAAANAERDEAVAWLRTVAEYEDDVTTGPWPDVWAFLGGSPQVAVELQRKVLTLQSTVAGLQGVVEAARKCRGSVVVGYSNFIAITPEAFYEMDAALASLGEGT